MPWAKRTSLDDCDGRASARCRRFSPQKRCWTVGAVWFFCCSLAHAIEITEGTHEGRAQFVVRTEAGTWFYDRAGGGFSRLIDRSGRDWIAFSKSPLSQFPQSAAAGYRGLPNLVFGRDNPDAGAGHPGFDLCESELVGRDTIRTRSRSGKWAWSWVFTESSATFTMDKADPEHPWWFLYEGPIAGSFAPASKTWGTDRGGPRREVPDQRNQIFDRWQWVYFGDVSVPRVLFLAQHEPDDLPDTLWYLGSSEAGAATAPDGMLVFGFGRGPGTRPQLRGAGQRFTVGLLELSVADAAQHARLAEKIEAVIESRETSAARGQTSKGQRGLHCLGRIFAVSLNSLSSHSSAAKFFCGDSGWLTMLAPALPLEASCSGNDGTKVGEE
jgi:hypothetical protein